MEDLIIKIGMENIIKIQVGKLKTTRSKVMQRLITVAN